MFKEKPYNQRNLNGNRIGYSDATVEYHKNVKLKKNQIIQLVRKNKQDTKK